MSICNYQFPFVLVILGLLSETVVGVTRLDYLDDKLPIPDSELFDHATYTQTGVGLDFGVDQRTTYFAGDYEQAEERFRVAAGTYPYRAEIWVFLSRALFWQDDPVSAGGILEEAAVVMPDLEATLWSPLGAGLRWEIRKRANVLRMQIDFYAPSQKTYSLLFQLYRFLEDFEGASDVIHACEARARKMLDRAEVSSALSFVQFRRASVKWLELAAELRDNMAQFGREVSTPPPAGLKAGPMPAPGHLDLLQETRLLQMKVDYYRGGPEDYNKLFEKYLKLGDFDRASGVIEAVSREAFRLQLYADTTPDERERVETESKVNTLKQQMIEFGKVLERPVIPGS